MEALQRDDAIVRARESAQSAWEKIAAGYDEFVTPTHLWLGNEGLQRVELRAGMRFLDVACGSGALSIPAARLGARVLATDVSPTMVERLKARTRKEGLHNLEARVMDGHSLELEDDRFDIAGSQFGVMLFPDLPRALAEMVRVTKPGGLVLLNVYGPAPQVEFLVFFMGAMQAVVPSFDGLPLDPPPLPFQVADPETLRQRLVEAGLQEVRIETVTESLEFWSGIQMWDWVTNSNPIARTLIADLIEKQVVEVQQCLEDMLREHSPSGPAVLTNPVHIAVGTN